MSERRTKKQKATAKRRLSFYFEEKPEVMRFQPLVKGQFDKREYPSKAGLAKREKAEPTAKVQGLGTIRRDIIKSLILASLILSTEIVIYLAWSH